MSQIIANLQLTRVLWCYMMKIETFFDYIKDLFSLKGPIILRYTGKVKW